MAESTHHIYKNEFLRGFISRSIKNHLDSLARFVYYYNHERRPGELYGPTPMQVIDGKIPDKHYFKEQISKAKMDRIATNRAFNACAFVR